MNRFLLAAKSAVQRNGNTVSYISVTQGVYDIEQGKVVNTEVTSSILAYKEGIQATQYNFPDLVGREVCRYYISGDAAVNPKPDDKITQDGETFTVRSVQADRAAGQVCLWRLVCSKG